MFCPVCKDSPLAMSERQGVEIDYCPRCRGVWLDRGELDKIIERVAVEAPAPTAARAPERPAPQAEAYRQPDPRQMPHGQHRDHYKDPYYKDGHYRKKKSLLGELFDFD